MMKNSFFCLIFLLPTVTANAQDSEQPAAADETQDVFELVEKLRNLMILRIDTQSDLVIQRQQQKIEIADQILAHEEVDDSQRAFANVAMLQSYAIWFNVYYRDKKNVPEFNEKYAQRLSDARDDEDERIVTEATTASASFYCGMFILDPNEERANLAADHLNQLVELGPKDPLIQSTRRLLLEQLLSSEEAKMVFEKIETYDKKVAGIALDQLAEKIEKPIADFRWAKHFANFGDFVSQRRLAKMYETGTGTRANNSQAARWYGKLARLGDINSQVKLGDFYLTGKGFTRNPETAVEYFQNASKSGSRVAQFKLAECYLNGLGVEQSDDNWKKWIKSAAFNASGADVQAIYQTIDFNESPDSYRIFYESLVEQYPEDIYFLNNFAYSLLISSDKDPKRALELIDRAIDNAPKDFDGIDNFIDTKATALKQLEKWKESAKLFESILENTEDKKPVLESLIECYEKLDSEKADTFRQQLNKLK
ncbi:MAG: hypothetical protein AAGA30_00660 [Planctomycetota bacterium]